MKKIMLFITSLFLLLFTACQEEDWGNHTPALEKGESLISFSLPEPVTATRAALGETPQVEHLHVLVFNEKGFFLGNAKATVVSQPADGAAGTFKVTLPVSNRPCRLHFVANADYDVEGKSWPTYVSTDTESTVLGAMTTSENRAAYWGMVSVDYISKDGVKLDSPVELIRNFAKVTLKTSTVGNYHIESYTVYNCPTEGLLAPFNPYDGSFADFVSVTNDDPYGNFVKQHPDYHGTTKGEIAVNELPAESEWKTPDIPFYVYERNQDNSDIPTALVLKAKNTTDSQFYYYKLDLIQFDNATYKTTTYNLFRNFAYDVTINAIKANGYTDANDAVQAAASNNLAASVQVSKVKKITDGNHTLEVSTIDTLIVRTDPLVLTFKYLEGTTDCTDTDELQVHYNQESAAFSKIDVNKSDGTITLTPRTPLPEVMLNEEITIATQSGLTRRIMVRVHQPYKFVSVDCQRLVAASQHQSFVLMTELPMGLPTAIFPMTLRIDMTNNTLYPDASMNRFPVDVVDAKNYVYQVEMDYNSYRQNRTIYSYFKTNTSQSATQISVEGTYFEESDPVSFTNGEPESFTGVKFAGTNVTTATDTKFTVPFGKGEAVDLEFYMETKDPVIVYTRYLTDPVSSYGTCIEKRNSENAVCGYEYEPKAPGKQVIRFQTREYLAGGRIELFSPNYVPVIINYTNPWVNVRFETPGGVVPDGRIVKVYEDAYYQNFAADLTPVSGGNGGTVMKSFVGNTRETILYFLYQEGGRSYRGEMAVGDLIDQGAGDGKSATVELRQR